MSLSIISESFTQIQGDQELFMGEKSFLNLTCIIQSVETPQVNISDLCKSTVLYCDVLYCTVQGVYWRHENQLLSSSGLVTVSPLSRRTNTTFAISLSVWLTSTQQSGEDHC